MLLFNTKLKKIIDICEKKSEYYSDFYSDEILLVEKYMSFVLKIIHGIIMDL